MKDPEKEQFAKMMVLLGESFQKNISSTTISAYWESLRIFSLEAVAIAIKRCMQESLWMPTSAEIRKFLPTSTLSESQAEFEKSSQRKIEYLADKHSLELQFGAELDAMTQEQKESLLVDNDFQLEHFRQYPNSGIVRFALLAAVQGAHADA